MRTQADLVRRQQLLAAIRLLRPVAKRLAADPASAEDLLQEAFLRAWANLDRFEPGTSMEAWLRVILRNIAYSEHRRRMREIADSDGSYAAHLVSLPDQDARLALQDVESALTQLPEAQRQAVLLVGAEGQTYETVAQICRTTIGTVKSRVHRARLQLSALLGDADPTP